MQPFQNLADKALTAFIYAMEETKAVDLPRIGTEQVLLGLYHVQDSSAGQILRQSGLELANLRSIVDTLTECEGLRPKNEGPIVQILKPLLNAMDAFSEKRLSEQVKEILVLSTESATNEGRMMIDTKDLLLSIIETQSCLAYKAIVVANLDPNNLKERLGHHAGDEE